MKCLNCNTPIEDPMYRYLDPLMSFGLFYIVKTQCRICEQSKKFYERENILFDAYNLVDINYIDGSYRGTGKTYKRTLRLQIVTWR